MFHSTRCNKKVNSFEAILSGLASDGGLYVSEQIPQIHYRSLIGLSYEEVTTKILHAYFNDFSYEEILEQVVDAYKNFQNDEKVTIRKINDAYFLELFNGPTLAFKDMALVIMPKLFTLAKTKLEINGNYNILIATSGDTGGAALNGFKNINGVNIFVMYPNQGISEIQERQMLSFQSENAKVIAVNGNFDDCQNIVKEFFAENKNLKLSSANSINIARLIPQIAYYYYTYQKLIIDGEITDNEKINFAVPTGNFGNIFAGFLAKKMGLPIKNLICASNENNVLTEFFQTGIYNKSRKFYKTNSPSMDIIVSSNLERFIYYACGEDQNIVKNLMKQFKDNGIYRFSNPYDYIFAYDVNEAQTNTTINDLYINSSYVIDPHTAVAYKAFTDYKAKTQDNTKSVIVSTASPFKFPSSVLKALNISPTKSEINNVKILSERFNLPIPKVLNYPNLKKEVWELHEVKSKLKEIMK